MVNPGEAGRRHAPLADEIGAVRLFLGRSGQGPADTVDGVRNFQAANNLKAMKAGDRAFLYHSNEGRRSWGWSRSSGSLSRSQGQIGPLRHGRREAAGAGQRPVTLAAIKAEPGSDFALVRHRACRYCRSTSGSGDPRQDGGHEALTLPGACAAPTNGRRRGARLRLGEGLARIAVFVLRHGADIHAYVNACPHLGTPLEFFPTGSSTRRPYLLCAPMARCSGPPTGLRHGPCAGKASSPRRSVSRTEVWLDDGEF